MSKEIAVFLDTSGQTISFNEAGIVRVYAKKNDEWDVVKEYKFSHIPPWFDNEIKSLNMQLEILMLSANQYKVTVWNKICGE